jgi:hypothetical protein
MKINKTLNNSLLLISVHRLYLLFHLQLIIHTMQQQLISIGQATVTLHATVINSHPLALHKRSVYTRKFLLARSKKLTGRHVA